MNLNLRIDYLFPSIILSSLSFNFINLIDLQNLRPMTTPNPTTTTALRTPTPTLQQQPPPRTENNSNIGYLLIGIGAFILTVTLVFFAIRRYKKQHSHSYHDRSGLPLYRPSSLSASVETLTAKKIPFNPSQTLRLGSPRLSVKATGRTMRT